MTLSGAGVTRPWAASPASFLQGQASGAPQAGSEGAAKRQAEIAALRGEVAAMLKDNQGLHAQLSQLHADGRPAIGASTGAQPLRAGPAVSFAALPPNQERRSLEERIRALSAECRSLEQTQVQAPPPLRPDTSSPFRSVATAGWGSPFPGAGPSQGSLPPPRAPVSPNTLGWSLLPATGPAATPPTPPTPPLGLSGAMSMTATLAPLLAQRDELHQQLHTAEIARRVAEQKAEESEAALARIMEELRAQAQSRQSEDPTRSPTRAGDWTAATDSVAMGLKREVTAMEASLADLEVALAAKSSELAKTERELAEVRVEHDALATANEALRNDVAITRARLEEERHNAQSAEADLARLQAQVRLSDVDLGAKLDAARARVHALERALAEGKSALETAEAEASAAKLEGLELQAQLQVLLAANDELSAQEEMNSREHSRQVAQMEARTEALAAEVAESSRQLELLRQPVAGADQSAADGSFVPSSERARAGDSSQPSQSKVALAGGHLEQMLRHLSEEQRRNAEMARELAAAKAAISEVSGVLQPGQEAVHWPVSRSSGPVSPVRRRKRSVGPRAPGARADTGRGSKPAVPSRPAAKACGRSQSAANVSRSGSAGTGGWAAMALGMHQELELLKHWRGEALGLLQQLQGDVSAARGQYRHQFQYNQDLQGKLEWMGQQAQAAAAAISGLCGAEQPLKPAATPTRPHTAEPVFLPHGPDFPEEPDPPELASRWPMSSRQRLTRPFEIPFEPLV